MAVTIWDGSFYVDTCIYDNTKYMVGPGKEICDTIGYTEGSFAVVASRLFGLSYPDYCRMVRDKYNGVLFGKVGKYFGICFADKKDAENLCKELKRRWNYVKESGVFDK